MTEDEELHRFAVEEQEAGHRLDHILAGRFAKKRSRSFFQSLISSGKVLINGRPTKKRVCPRLSDWVEVFLPPVREIELVSEDLPLTILYEDEDLLVINKPAGLVVHPAPGHWTGTLVNRLLHHCPEMKEIGEERLRPGIVHRLDRETSGVLVVAKSAPAYAGLVTAFASGAVHKEYWALCIGNPGTKKIEWPLGRHPVQRKKRAVIEGGRPAQSLVETVRVSGNLSLVQVFPKTGRTHQIRVHLAHGNTPVLGDSLYGSRSANRSFSATRQMLHAHRLSLSHPVSGEEMEWIAPIPEDMNYLINQM